MSKEKNTLAEAKRLAREHSWEVGDFYIHQIHRGVCGLWWTVGMHHGYIVGDALAVQHPIRARALAMFCAALRALPAKKAKER